ncbi:Fanconi anemia core complex-associated protein 24-like isoform X1 [Mobula birostris]|uniref:Fanconi anemia core complex-associated protein 24-like isoform X1 n=1 Tax=Mobula birostris TaxID=1983395 RepID=UPI003B27FCDB
MDALLNPSVCSTPVRAGASAVPFGHVIVNEKWRGSELALGCQGRITVVFEDGLGLVDFHLSKRLCVLYISEADLVAGNGYKRKLVRFRNASTLNGVVLVEKTRLSEQYFAGVQKFVVLELGLTLLPVASQSEAAQLIAQLVHEEGRDRDHNPFLRHSRSVLSDTGILASVQKIPGVGKVKAMNLLCRFPSIQQLSAATQEELEPVTGPAVAQQITEFFSPVP